MQSRQFSEKRKGYDVQEIDEFIDEVMFSLGEYSARLEAASARAVELETRLAGLEQQAGSSEEAAAELARARQESQDAKAETARLSAELAQASQGTASLSGQVEAARTQLEAARESHIRQQAQIVALQEEVTHLRGLLEQERSAPRAPEEVAQAVEVLAAAQRTADDLRREAQETANAVRESAEQERDAALAGFRDEAAAVRTRLDELVSVEAGFRARLAELLDAARDSLLGQSIVSVPADAADLSWIPEPRAASAERDVEASSAPAETIPADDVLNSWGHSDPRVLGEGQDLISAASTAEVSWESAGSSSDALQDASVFPDGTVEVSPEPSSPEADLSPTWGGGYDISADPQQEQQPPADQYSSDYDQPRAWGVSS